MGTLLFAVAFKDGMGNDSNVSIHRVDKTSSSASIKGKDKGSRSKGVKESKEKISRPNSQHFDSTKPNWTLRIVSDASSAVSGLLHSPGGASFCKT